MWRVSVTPLSVLFCLSLCVSLIFSVCDYLSTVILQVLFSCYFFLWRSPTSFYFILWCGVYSGVPAPISVMQFALLFYLFFFSQCCYNLFPLQFFADFSYCCCIVITFSTKYHSCILLRNPQTACRARISNLDSGGRCHLTIPRRFSCPV